MKLDLSDRPKFLDEAIVWRTPSESRPGIFHFTMKLRHGGMVYSCEGHQYNGHCKHTASAPTEQEPTEIISRWRQEHLDRPAPRRGGPDPHDYH